MRLLDTVSTVGARGFYTSGADTQSYPLPLVVSLDKRVLLMWRTPTNGRPANMCPFDPR